MLIPIQDLVGEGLVPDSSLDIIKTALEGGVFLGRENLQGQFATRLPFGIQSTKDAQGKTVYFRTAWSNVQTHKRPATSILNVYALPKDSKALWAPVHALWRLWQRLRLMRRFIDGRNPEVPGKPLPDGSNIPRRLHALTTAWTLHRAWIRMLHYRSLVVGPLSFGFQHLQSNLRLSMGVLLLELKDIPFRPSQKQMNFSRYTEIFRMHQQVANALINIGNFIALETRPVDEIDPNASTRLYNIHPDRLGPAIKEVSHTSLSMQTRR